VPVLHYDIVIGIDLAYHCPCPLFSLFQSGFIGKPRMVRSVIFIRAKKDIKRKCLMKKLLFLLTVTVMLSGCVVYPGYYGHYTSDNYGFPYGYAGPNINFHYTGVYGGRGHHGGYGHHHGGYRGWHR
jgi:hypothetical protein